MRLFALILVATLWGCATVPPAPTKTPSGVYDVGTGSRLTQEQFRARIVAADYVLVGESHDSAEDHALQLEVFRTMASHRRVALGMEMFQRPYQAALDAYVAGELDEAQMLAQTEWESRWGFATELYRPLWQFARETSSPILALNVRRELTKRVSAVGIAGLSDDERVDVVEIDLSREDYRSWLKDVFSGHGMQMDDAKFQRFYEAQLLWDETMADTAVAFRKSQPEEVAVLVVVGRGHVEHGWGIPSRIQRRDPSASVLVLVRAAEPMTLEQAKQAKLADILVIP
ncbi:MAG: ChaN family lipoprotein [bacterium]